MINKIVDTRKNLRNRLDQFVQLWTGESNDLNIFTPEIVMEAFQYGHVVGADQIKATFVKDIANHQLTIRPENVYIAGQGSKATISTYLIGNLDNKDDHLTFQGTLVLDLIKNEHEWLINEIRLVHGTDNHLTLPHWKQSFNYRRFWQPNDPTSVIISEFDSPWKKYPHNEFAPTDKVQQIQDLFSKYAWGIDQADWGNLSDVFAEDAESELMPMGHQIGRRNVFGQLRQFRLASQYLHHIGRVLNVDFTTEKTADIFLGRLISEQDIEKKSGQRLYGAYYEIKARLEDDGKWRFTFMNYQPRWFTYKED